MEEMTENPTGVAEATTSPEVDTAAESNTSAPDESASTPTTPASPSEPAPSKRDAFRSRVGSRYKDLNLDDEDAYYDQMGKMMDEYEGYEKSSARMRASIAKSPAMSEMVRAAGQQEDFDPLIWLTENRGLDLDALRDDPDYAQKLAEAHSRYLERDAEAKKIADDMAANMPASVDAIRAKAQELGLSDEEAEAGVGQMYQIMDDLIHGKMNPDLFAMVVKGAKHDKDVAQARDEGQAAGLSTKIDEKLRKDAGRTPKPVGRQMAAGEAKPKVESNNPFAHV